MKKIVLIIFLLPSFIRSEPEQIDDQIDSLEKNMEMFDTINNASNNLRVDAIVPPKHNFTLLKPLIIDKNNHDYDDQMTIKLEGHTVYKPELKYNYPSPYGSYPAAIIVAKDNMTIDLNGYTLSLDPTSAPNFLTNNPVYGIAVYRGVKNLKIISSSPLNQKGIITGFSDFAIYIDGLDESYNSYDIYANRVKNILIDNILITQNLNGIYVANGLEITVSNTNVIYNYTARPFFGIYFSNILEGIIENCKINLNSSFTDMHGINLEDTINVTVQNSQTNINRSSQTGHATGMQITAINDSSGNQILNCTSSGNLCAPVNGQKSIGFNIKNQSHNNVIENCNAFLNNQVPGSAITQGIGFQIDTGINNQIHKNKSGYNNTYGFYDTAAISTSLWTSNSGIFNGTSNYNIIVPTALSSTPLPRIIVTPDDLSAYLAAGPVLANISVELP